MPKQPKEYPCSVLETDYRPVGDHCFLCAERATQVTEYKYRDSRKCHEVIKLCDDVGLHPSQAGHIGSRRVMYVGACEQHKFVVRDLNISVSNSRRFSIPRVLEVLLRRI